MTRVLGLGLAVAWLAVGLGHSASATTLPSSAIALSNGATLTTPDLVYKVSGFLCNDDGACPTLYMVPNSGPGLGVIIEAATGAPGTGTIAPYILSFSCSTVGGCSPNGEYDLSLTLTVTPTAISPLLTGASLAVAAGSNTSPGLTTDPGFGFGNETVQNGSRTMLCDLDGPISSCDGFIGQTKLVMTKDIGLGTGAVTIPDGGTISLGSITEGFAVPEPASMASLLIGVIALGAVRGKRQRT
jgi:hypothetical protein